MSSITTDNKAFLNELTVGGHFNTCSQTLLKPPAIARDSAPVMAMRSPWCSRARF